MAKSSSLKRTISFSMSAVAAFVLVFGVVGAYAIWRSFAAPAPPGVCSINPSPASVNQSYTISASGLPTKDSNWLLTYPPSGQANATVEPVYVSSTGTWSGTKSANATGVWTYVFSGLLKNHKYGTVAECSVQIN